RRLEDRPRRTVVLLQDDRLGTDEVRLEVQDVANVGLAPTVDRLVLVADDADALRALAQQANERVLGEIRVLKLVDEDVAVALTVAGQDARLALEKLDRLHEEVVEVEEVAGLKRLLVVAVDRRGELFEVRFGCAAILVRPDQLALG